MIPNLKVDIIYYKTPSDFELEFNLSGICRMRIFKDKADSPKSLINILARDVSRSRIILIVTNLLENANGVQIVSDAVGLPLEAPDKPKYGIKSSDKILMPKGALPLVTKSGMYGGCIAEANPQAIIMVSDDRALRHEVMNKLVHPYIFDVSQVAAYNERVKQAGGSQFLTPISPFADSQVLTGMEPEATLPMEPETVPAASDTAEEPAPAEPEMPVEPEASTEPEIPVVSEESQPEVNTEEPEQPDESADTVPLSLFNADTGDFIAPILVTGDQDDETIAPDDEPQTRIKKKNKGSSIALLIIAVLLLVGFGVLAYYFLYLPLVQGQTPRFIKEISQLLRNLGLGS